MLDAFLLKICWMRSCVGAKMHIIRLVHGNGIPMGNVPWDGMGWDSTNYISRGTHGTVAM